MATRTLTKEETATFYVCRTFSVNAQTGVPNFFAEGDYFYKLKQEVSVNVYNSKVTAYNALEDIADLGQLMGTDIDDNPIQIFAQPNRPRPETI